VEDKAVEELELHQRVIANDDNSPLELIREKEMEISGRVLQSKREADEIIADARRLATDRIVAAETEGSAEGQQRREQVAVEAKSQAEEAVAVAEKDAAGLEQRIAQNKGEAVKLILSAVSRV
jgi:vacuolar-type H+-ATPase subunit H